MKMLPEGECEFMAIMSMASHYTRGLDKDEHALVHHHMPDGARSEMTWLNGKLHNLKGAAVVSSDGKGNRRELYCVDGLMHRADGPAYISIDAQGNKTEEHYHHGKFVPTPDAPKNGPKPAIAFGAFDEVVELEPSDYVDLGPLSPDRDVVLDAEFEEVKGPTKPQKRGFNLRRILGF